MGADNTFGETNFNPKDRAKAIAIVGADAPPAIKTVIESMRDDVIIVESAQDAVEIMKGTSSPELKQPRPFIIKAPPAFEQTFEDYPTGRQNRRDRRARERKRKR